MVCDRVACETECVTESGGGGGGGRVQNQKQDPRTKVKKDFFVMRAVF